MASTSVSPQIGISDGGMSHTHRRIASLVGWVGVIGWLCRAVGHSQQAWLWHVNVNVNVPDRTVLYSSAKTLQAA